MKTIKILLLSVSFFLTVIQTSPAQGIPVMDITHIALTVANGAVLEDQLEKLQEQVAVSYLIEDKVSDIYNLQYDYRQHLKQVESVQDLAWVDLQNSAEQSSALVTNMDAYVSGITGIEALKRAYENPSSLKASYELFSHLDGFSAGTALPGTHASLKGKMQDLSRNQYAMDEMAAKKKIQTALSYNQIAKDLLEKAQQLSDELLINERFSMSEGERLSCIKQAHDYILQSMQLKLSADELIQEVMQQAQKVKEGSLKAYQHQLERKVLSTTPIY